MHSYCVRAIFDGILFLTNCHIENIQYLWYLELGTQLNSLMDLGQWLRSVWVAEKLKMSICDPIFGADTFFMPFRV